MFSQHKNQRLSLAPAKFSMVRVRQQAQNRPEIHPFGAFCNSGDAGSPGVRNMPKGSMASGKTCYNKKSLVRCGGVVGTSFLERSWSCSQLLSYSSVIKGEALARQAARIGKFLVMCLKCKSGGNPKMVRIPSCLQRRQPAKR